MRVWGGVWVCWVGEEGEGGERYSVWEMRVCERVLTGAVGLEVVVVAPTGHRVDLRETRGNQGGDGWEGVEVEPPSASVKHPCASPPSAPFKRLTQPLV